MTKNDIHALGDFWIDDGRTFGEQSDLREACYQDPETAWKVILYILTKDIEIYLEASLAAGPLEDLLSAHGPSFIERIENEAKSNPRFYNLLHGVDRLNMTDDVWHRVQQIRNSVA